MESEPFEEDILLQENAERMVNRVESFMLSRLPEKDPNMELVSDIVYRIREDRTIMKVDDAVRLTGLNKRTLQRLFDRYVGVSPKWVIQRCRLHEAAEWIGQGSIQHWSELSAELGYYDQSHFIRDFKSVVGVSPMEYWQQNH